MRLFALLISFFLWASISQARLGESKQQCDERYGPPTPGREFLVDNLKKFLPELGDVNCVSYEYFIQTSHLKPGALFVTPEGFYIRVFIFYFASDEPKVELMKVTKFGNFSDKEVSLILKRNSVAGGFKEYKPPETKENSVYWRESGSGRTATWNKENGELWLYTELGWRLAVEMVREVGRAVKENEDNRFKQKMDRF